MPDKVEVTVAPTALAVTAGDTVEASATLRNLGQTVDQLTISIDGLDPSWCTLPVSSVALFPNDQDNLKIILHPPKTAETTAGSYPFRINVTSQENPEETATVDLTIEIQTLPEMELSLSPPRITWVMLPAGPTVDDHIVQLKEILSPGDIVIDGGNTYYKDDIRRADLLAEKEIKFIDAGVSGGIWV